MSIRALDISASGMIAHSNGLAVTANNLANLETPSFKRSSVTFQNLVAQNLGSGVSLASTTRDQRPGNLISTGRELDIAIDGDAFFPLTSPTGETYFTRAGSFSRSATGEVILPVGEGFSLAPPLNLPDGTTNVAIATDGIVTGQVNGENRALGRITGVRFANPEGLIAVGNNLFAEGGASGAPNPVAFGATGQTLRQGFLEASNVELTTELVALIASQQAFSANAEIFRAANERLVALSELTK